MISVFTKVCKCWVGGERNTGFSHSISLLLLLLLLLWQHKPLAIVLSSLTPQRGKRGRDKENHMVSLSSVEVSSKNQKLSLDKL